LKNARIQRKLPIVARLLQRSRLRIPIVITAALGWVALFNHCALAVVQPGDGQRPMSCHDSGAQKDTPAQDRQSEVECCKVIRATLITPEKNLPAFAELFALPCSDWVALLVPDGAVEGSLLEWDTGPPGVRSFSESVLQESILAHAPPFLV